MGQSSSTPKNSTSKSVLTKKLTLSSKTGTLSLSTHSLSHCPQLPSSLRTVDLSLNSITNDDVNLASFISNANNLKTLNLANNLLHAGALPSLEHLTSLVTLDLSSNPLGVLGKTGKAGKTGKTKTGSASSSTTLPPLPPSIKTLLLNNTKLSVIPEQVYALVNVVTLNLSSNNLTGSLCCRSRQTHFSRLSKLEHLIVDDNQLTSVADAADAELDGGAFGKLKTLSVQNNSIAALPRKLLAGTMLQDLNLRGNPVTKRELMEMDGFEDFEKRRGEVKRKDDSAGVMSGLSLCGLD
jgi:Leucine-rich repeat (LRR) protein